MILHNVRLEEEWRVAKRITKSTGHRSKVPATATPVTAPVTPVTPITAPPHSTQEVPAEKAA